MPMDLGMRDSLLYDSMHCTTAVSLEMSDEPKEILLFCSILKFPVIPVTLISIINH